ncbi:MAG: hypothetical protein HY707_06980 [Ignavibacteriae bacterium]|nr:hypothetical protein [Ignavibacteriota bacterium]
MSKYLNQRWLFPLILFSSIAILLCIADRAPLHLKSRFPAVHLEKESYAYLDGVVNRTFPGPFVYRVLIPYTVHIAHSVFPLFDPLTIDFALKTIILMMCQVAFFLYLRNFFTDVHCLACVFLLDVLIGHSLAHFQGPSIIETVDLLNVFFFILALTFIYTNKSITLYITLFLASLNRETIWFVIIVIILHDQLTNRGILRSLLSLSVVSLSYFGLRLMIGMHEFDWFYIRGLVHNIPFISEEFTTRAIVGNLRLAVLLLPMMVIGIYQFKSHPQYLKIASSIIPVFIVAHYLVGIIIESRLWMPLFVVLVPLTINNLIKILRPREEQIPTSPI